MKFYVTMGQSHAHSINHDGEWVTVDKDGLVEIEAPDENTANERAHELFGPKFCAVYRDIGFEFYPRGVVLSV